MGKKKSLLPTTKERLRSLKKNFQPNTFTILDQSELKKLDVISDKYTDKCNGAVVISSGSKDESWLSIVTYRHDPDYGEIDKDFIGAYFSTSYATENLIQKHHGDWHDRSVPIPADFEVQISGSLANMYHFKDMPVYKSGSWSDIESDNKSLFEAGSVSKVGVNWFHPYEEKG